MKNESWPANIEVNICVKTGYNPMVVKPWAKRIAEADGIDVLWVREVGNLPFSSTVVPTLFLATVKQRRVTEVFWWCAGTHVEGANDFQKLFGDRVRPAWPEEI